VDGLLREHSTHEMEYTPDVYDARKVLDWREEVAVLEREGWERGWKEVAMEGMSDMRRALCSERIFANTKVSHLQSTKWHTASLSSTTASSAFLSSGH